MHLRPGLPVDCQLQAIHTKASAPVALKSMLVTNALTARLAPRCLAAKTLSRLVQLRAAAMAAAPSAVDLRGQSCSILGGCSSDTPKISEAELPQYMVALPAWQLSADKASISRSFVAKNFVAAVRFFDQVAAVAEQEGHHPDLHLTNYREVQVVLSTHAIKGLSMFDFILAAKLDALEVEYSPKWLKQNQHILMGQANAPGDNKQQAAS